jgi:ABC-type Fe3+-siderophore transport system permease subunit
MPPRWITRLSGLLLLAALASLLTGYRWLSPVQILHLLSSPDPALSSFLLEYRLPRMLIAPICGAALAVAGLLLQSVTRNPLAAPDILGINAAASMCVVLALFFIPDLALSWLNLLAFLAAVGMTCLLLLMLRQIDERDSVLRLPLLGTVLSLLFSSVTQTVLTLDPSTQDQALSWLTGNIAGRSVAQLMAALPWLLVAVVLIVRLLPRLDLFYLGDTQISALGFHPQRLRLMAILACSLLVAGAVSVVGPVGFIGLLTPRMAHFLVPHQHRVRLPVAALLGALALTLADVLARFILFPEDVPVGAVTAFIGGPVLLALLYRRRRFAYAR